MNLRWYSCLHGVTLNFVYPRARRRKVYTITCAGGNVILEQNRDTMERATGT